MGVGVVVGKGGGNLGMWKGGGRALSGKEGRGRGERGRERGDAISKRG